MSDSSPLAAGSGLDQLHRQRCAGLRQALTTRVVVADGAMGTMVQAAANGGQGEKPLTLQDFQGHEGCNEILNLTRPTLIAQVHQAYLAAGADCVETNSFGANWSNLSDYGIADQVEPLARRAADIARHCADAASTPQRPRWVLGSMGPGTKLPSLGQVEFTALRDAYQAQARGLLAGGADALLIETCQDLLQAKAALLGARAAIRQLAPADLPSQQLPALIVSVTMETTGTMLLGSDMAAALAVLDGLGVDLIGLNCATGPEQMGEHLRLLAGSAKARLACLPNAGLPVLGPLGASYPLQPEQFAQAVENFADQFGLALVGGCCGTTPEHIAALVRRVGGRPQTSRTPRPLGSALASLYTAQPLETASAAHAATSYLCVGERTNANGSKAFREALLAGALDECVEIARAQTLSGSHLLDVCVDYVGRDGQADMEQLVARLATSCTVPLMLDSTQPQVLHAGLQRYGGRVVLNSVNYEDGDGPDSRFTHIMALAKEHGCAVVALTIDEQGQARTVEHKLAVARRLMAQLTGPYGLDEADIFLDCLTFPIATGQEETRRDAVATLAAMAQLRQEYPRVQLVLGVSNVSFGLKPAARQVLNSVFLQEAVQAGLSAAIVNPTAIIPLARLQSDQLQAALALIHDQRLPDQPDPLEHYLSLFSEQEPASLIQQRQQEWATMPVQQRLVRRIVQGQRPGLSDDLDEALAQGTPALELINDYLLEGMREVGELFGSGAMQLPFVLQSAEVMKAAVSHLEPHLDAVVDGNDPTTGRGTIVLATVRGDVHDIGKNLVDIILTNNGYRVINLGIKQPVSAIIEAAQQHDADVIGMSGLLVKSTVIMQENLQELTARGLARRWPVILGGAALTRPYVEDDLASQFDGHVRYARDAFEGLALMGPLVALSRGVPDAELSLPPLRKRRVSSPAAQELTPTFKGQLPAPRRSVQPAVSVPSPPWWGSRVVRGVALEDFAAYLDQRALFVGQWGLRASQQRSAQELAEQEGQPRLRHWLSYLRTEDLLETGVVYGYFPCASQGDELVIYGVDEAGQPQIGDQPLMRWSFPRQTRDAHLCLADYWLPVEQVHSSGSTDVVALQLVTMGSKLSQATAELFADDRYRDYLELHGLSVQLTEALAEYWHARIRQELGLASGDASDIDGILRQHYQGERYSFGYPACPNLKDRAGIVELLAPERIGVTLSPEWQLHPEQSTDALIAHHPAATYFSTGATATAPA